MLSPEMFRALSESVSDAIDEAVGDRVPDSRDPLAALHKMDSGYAENISDIPSDRKPTAGFSELLAIQADAESKELTQAFKHLYPDRVVGDDRVSSLQVHQVIKSLESRRKSVDMSSPEYATITNEINHLKYGIRQAGISGEQAFETALLDAAYGLPPQAPVKPVSEDLWRPGGVAVPRGRELWKNIIPSTGRAIGDLWGLVSPYALIGGVLSDLGAGEFITGGVDYTEQQKMLGGVISELGSFAMTPLVSAPRVERAIGSERGFRKELPLTAGIVRHFQERGWAGLVEQFEEEPGEFVLEGAIGLATGGGGFAVSGVRRGVSAAARVAGRTLNRAVSGIDIDSNLYSAIRSVSSGVAESAHASSIVNLRGYNRQGGVVMTGTGLVIGEGRVVTSAHVPLTFIEEGRHVGRGMTQMSARTIGDAPLTTRVSGVELIDPVSDIAILKLDDPLLPSDVADAAILEARRADYLSPESLATGDAYARISARGVTPGDVSRFAFRELDSGNIIDQSTPHMTYTGTGAGVAGESGAPMFGAATPERPLGQAVGFYGGTYGERAQFVSSREVAALSELSEGRSVMPLRDVATRDNAELLGKRSRLSRFHKEREDPTGYPTVQLFDLEEGRDVGFQTLPALSAYVGAAALHAAGTSERTFGVELELFLPDEHQRRLLTAHVLHDWSVTTDPSLRHSQQQGMSGLEVVSPVLRGAEGISSVEQVTQTLRRLGGVVNEQTGTHVHIGVEDLDASQLANVAGHISRLEPWWRDLFAESRRRSRWTEGTVLMGRPAGIYPDPLPEAPRAASGQYYHERFHDPDTGEIRGFSELARHLGSWDAALRHRESIYEQYLQRVPTDTRMGLARGEYSSDVELWRLGMSSWESSFPAWRPNEFSGRDSLLDEAASWTPRERYDWEQQFWGDIQAVVPRGLHAVKRFLQQGRYYAFNVMSPHGTIESRIHQGTLAAGEITSHVKRLSRFIDRSLQTEFRPQEIPALLNPEARRRAYWPEDVSDFRMLPDPGLVMDKYVDLSGEGGPSRIRVGDAIAQGFNIQVHDDIALPNTVPISPALARSMAQHYGFSASDVTGELEDWIFLYGHDEGIARFRQHAYPFLPDTSLGSGAQVAGADTSTPSIGAPAVLMRSEVPRYPTESSLEWGIEVEMFVAEGSRYRAGVRPRPRGFTVTDDSSLDPAGFSRPMRGIEFVSRVFQGEEGIERIHNLLSLGRRDRAGPWDINETAGLHIHVDRSSLTLEQEANIGGWLATRLEPGIRQQYPEHRRYHPYTAVSMFRDLDAELPRRTPEIEITPGRWGSYEELEHFSGEYGAAFQFENIVEAYTRRYRDADPERVNRGMIMRSNYMEGLGLRFSEIDRPALAEESRLFAEQSAGWTPEQWFEYEEQYRGMLDAALSTGEVWDLQRVLQPGLRYAGFNWISRHGTLENRLGFVSLDPTEIEQQVRRTIGLVEMLKDVPFEPRAHSAFTPEQIRHFWPEDPQIRLHGGVEDKFVDLSEQGGPSKIRVADAISQGFNIQIPEWAPNIAVPRTIPYDDLTTSWHPEKRGLSGTYEEWEAVWRNVRAQEYFLYNKYPISDTDTWSRGDAIIDMSASGGPSRIRVGDAIAQGLNVQVPDWAPNIAVPRTVPFPDDPSRPELSAGNLMGTYEEWKSVYNIFRARPAFEGRKYPLALDAYSGRESNIFRTGVDDIVGSPSEFQSLARAHPMVYPRVAHPSENPFTYRAESGELTAYIASGGLREEDLPITAYLDRDADKESLWDTKHKHLVRRSGLYVHKDFKDIEVKHEFDYSYPLNPDFYKYDLSFNPLEDTFRDINLEDFRQLRYHFGIAIPSYDIGMNYLDEEIILPLGTVAKFQTILPVDTFSIGADANEIIGRANFSDAADIVRRLPAARDVPYRDLWREHIAGGYALRDAFMRNLSRDTGIDISGWDEALSSVNPEPIRTLEQFSMFDGQLERWERFNLHGGDDDAPRRVARSRVADQFSGLLRKHVWDFKEGIDYRESRGYGSWEVFGYTEMLAQFMFDRAPEEFRQGMRARVPDTGAIERPYDVILPMPSHIEARTRRGFSPTEELAFAFANLALDEQILLRPPELNILQVDTSYLGVVGGTQKRRHMSERHRHVNRFSVNEDVLESRGGPFKNILLIEDVVMTGATVKDAVRVLGAAGAEKIDVLSIGKRPWLPREEYSKERLRELYAEDVAYKDWYESWKPEDATSELPVGAPPANLELHHAIKAQYREILSYGSTQQPNDPHGFRYDSSFSRLLRAGYTDDREAVRHMWRDLVSAEQTELIVERYPDVRPKYVLAAELSLFENKEFPFTRKEFEDYGPVPPGLLAPKITPAYTYESLMAASTKQLFNQAIQRDLLTKDKSWGRISRKLFGSPKIGLRGYSWGSEIYGNLDKVFRLHGGVSDTRQLPQGLRGSLGLADVHPSIFFRLADPFEESIRHHTQDVWQTSEYGRSDRVPTPDAYWREASGAFGESIVGGSVFRRGLYGATQSSRVMQEGSIMDAFQRGLGHEEMPYGMTKELQIHVGARTPYREFLAPSEDVFLPLGMLDRFGTEVDLGTQYQVSSEGRLFAGRSDYSDLQQLISAIPEDIPADALWQELLSGDAPFLMDEWRQRISGISQQMGIRLHGGAEDKFVNLSEQGGPSNIRVGDAIAQGFNIQVASWNPDLAVPERVEAFGELGFGGGQIFAWTNFLLDVKKARSVFEEHRFPLSDDVPRLRTDALIDVSSVGGISSIRAADAIEQGVAQVFDWAPNRAFPVRLDPDSVSDTLRTLDALPLLKVPELSPTERGLLRAGTFAEWRSVFASRNINTADKITSLLFKSHSFPLAFDFDSYLSELQTSTGRVSDFGRAASVHPLVYPRVAHPSENPFTYRPEGGELSTLLHRGEIREDELPITAYLDRDTEHASIWHPERTDVVRRSGLYVHKDFGRIREVGYADVEHVKYDLAFDPESSFVRFDEAFYQGHRELRYHFGIPIPSRDIGMRNPNEEIILPLGTVARFQTRVPVGTRSIGSEATEILPGSDYRELEGIVERLPRGADVPYVDLWREHIAGGSTLRDQFMRDLSRDTGIDISGWDEALSGISPEPARTLEQISRFEEELRGYQLHGNYGGVPPELSSTAPLSRFIDAVKESPLTFIRWANPEENMYRHRSQDDWQTTTYVSARDYGGTFEIGADSYVVGHEYLSGVFENERDAAVRRRGIYVKTELADYELADYREVFRDVGLEGDPVGKELQVLVGLPTPTRDHFENLTEDVILPLGSLQRIPSTLPKATDNVPGYQDYDVFGLGDDGYLFAGGVDFDELTRKIEGLPHQRDIAWESIWEHHVFNEDQFLREYWQDRLSREVGLDTRGWSEYKQLLASGVVPGGVPTGKQADVFLRELSEFDFAGAFQLHGARGNIPPKISFEAELARMDFVHEANMSSLAFWRWANPEENMYRHHSQDDAQTTLAETASAYMPKVVSQDAYYLDKSHLTGVRENKHSGAVLRRGLYVKGADSTDPELWRDAPAPSTPQGKELQLIVGVPTPDRMYFETPYEDVVLPIGTLARFSSTLERATHNEPYTQIYGMVSSNDLLLDRYMFAGGIDFSDLEERVRGLPDIRDIPYVGLWEEHMLNDQPVLRERLQGQLQRDVGLETAGWLEYKDSLARGEVPGGFQTHKEYREFRRLADEFKVDLHGGTDTSRLRDAESLFSAVAKHRYAFWRVSAPEENPFLYHAESSELAEALHMGDISDIEDLPTTSYFSGDDPSVSVWTGEQVEVRRRGIYGKQEIVGITGELPVSAGNYETIGFKSLSLHFGLPIASRDSTMFPDEEVFLPLGVLGRLQTNIPVGDPSYALTGAGYRPTRAYTGDVDFDVLHQRLANVPDPMDVPYAGIWEEFMMDRPPVLREEFMRDTFGASGSDVSGWSAFKEMQARGAIPGGLVAGTSRHDRFMRELEPFRFQLQLHGGSQDFPEVESSKLTFGVEIETFVRGFDYRMMDVRWDVVSDSSLDNMELGDPSYEGLEFVSPVLRGEAGIREARDIHADLEAFDAQYDYQTGLHIHVGIPDWDQRDKAQFAGWASRLDPWFREWHDETRSMHYAAGSFLTERTGRASPIGFEYLVDMGAGERWVERDNLIMLGTAQARNIEERAWHAYRSASRNYQGTSQAPALSDLPLADVNAMLEPHGVRVQGWSQDIHYSHKSLLQDAERWTPQDRFEWEQRFYGRLNESLTRGQGLVQDVQPDGRYFAWNLRSEHPTIEYRLPGGTEYADELEHHIRSAVRFVEGTTQASRFRPTEIPGLGGTLEGILGSDIQQRLWPSDLRSFKLHGGEELSGENLKALESLMDTAQFSSRAFWRVAHRSEDWRTHHSQDDIQTMMYSEMSADQLESEGVPTPDAYYTLLEGSPEYLRNTHEGAVRRRGLYGIFDPHYLAPYYTHDIGQFFLEGHRQPSDSFKELQLHIGSQTPYDSFLESITGEVADYDDEIAETVFLSHGILARWETDIPVATDNMMQGQIYRLGVEADHYAYTGDVDFRNVEAAIRALPETFYPHKIWDQFLAGGANPERDALDARVRDIKTQFKLHGGDPGLTDAQKTMMRELASVVDANPNVFWRLAHRDEDTFSHYAQDDLQTRKYARGKISDVYPDSMVIRESDLESYQYNDLDAGVYRMGLYGYPESRFLGGYTNIDSDLALLFERGGLSEDPNDYKQLQLLVGSSTPVREGLEGSVDPRGKFITTEDIYIPHGVLERFETNVKVRPKNIPLTQDITLSYGNTALLGDVDISGLTDLVRQVPDVMPTEQRWQRHIRGDADPERIAYEMQLAEQIGEYQEITGRVALHGGTDIDEKRQRQLNMLFSSVAKHPHTFWRFRAVDEDWRTHHAQDDQQTTRYMKLGERARESSDIPLEDSYFVSMEGLADYRQNRLEGAVFRRGVYGYTGTEGVLGMSKSQMRQYRAKPADYFKETKRTGMDLYRLSAFVGSATPHKRYLEAAGGNLAGGWGAGSAVEDVFIPHLLLFEFEVMRYPRKGNVPFTQNLFLQGKEALLDPRDDLKEYRSLVRSLPEDLPESSIWREAIAGEDTQIRSEIESMLSETTGIQLHGGTGKFPNVRSSQRTFGVEIETFVPTSFNYLIGQSFKGWDIRGDGSLQWHRGAGHVGYEFVSPVLRGETGVREAVDMHRELVSRGAEFNLTTGLHIHVGVPDFSDQDYINFAGWASRLDPWFRENYPSHRRDDSYTRGSFLMDQVPTTNLVSQYYFDRDTGPTGWLDSDDLINVHDDSYDRDMAFIASEVMTLPSRYNPYARSQNLPEWQDLSHEQRNAITQRVGYREVEQSGFTLKSVLDESVDWTPEQRHAWEQRFLARTQAHVGARSNLLGDIQDRSKYAAWNMLSVHPTVEFRLPPGTADSSYLEQQIRSAVRFVEGTTQGEFTPEVLKGLDRGRASRRMRRNYWPSNVSGFKLHGGRLPGEGRLSDDLRQSVRDLMLTVDLSHNTFWRVAHRSEDWRTHHSQDDQQTMMYHRLSEQERHSKAIPTHDAYYTLLEGSPKYLRNASEGAVRRRGLYGYGDSRYLHGEFMVNMEDIFLEGHLQPSDVGKELQLHVGSESPYWQYLEDKTGDLARDHTEVVESVFLSHGILARWDTDLPLTEVNVPHTQDITLGGWTDSYAFTGGADFSKIKSAVKALPKEDTSYEIWLHHIANLDNPERDALDARVRDIKTQFKLHGGTRFPEVRSSQRTFGVEIETFVPQGTGVANLIEGGFPGWEAARDGSLHAYDFYRDAYEGYEFVSPVLRGEEGLREALAVHSELGSQGAGYDVQTGLHIHVGVPDWGMPEIANFAGWVSRLEPWFRENFHADRHTGGFASGSFLLDRTFSKEYDFKFAVDDVDAGTFSWVSHDDLYYRQPSTDAERITQALTGHRPVDPEGARLIEEIRGRVRSMQDAYNNEPEVRYGRFRRFQDLEPSEVNQYTEAVGFRMDVVQGAPIYEDVLEESLKWTPEQRAEWEQRFMTRVQERIAGNPTEKDFYKEIQGEGRYKSWNVATEYPTVEFRFPAGTESPDELEHHVRSAVRFVEGTTQSEFRPEVLTELNKGLASPSMRMNYWPSDLSGFQLHGGGGSSNSMNRYRSSPFLLNLHQLGVVSNDSDFPSADLNTQQELDFIKDFNKLIVAGNISDVPHIGPKRAQAITDYHLQYGDFSSFSDVLNVPGIGESILNKIKTGMFDMLQGPDTPSTSQAEAIEASDASSSMDDHFMGRFNEWVQAGDIQWLPHVGPATSKRIQSQYKEHGDFGTLSDLAAVKGISKSSIGRIRGAVYQRGLGVEGVKQLWGSFGEGVSGIASSLGNVFGDIPDTFSTNISSLQSDYEQRMHTIENLSESDRAFLRGFNMLASGFGDLDKVRSVGPTLARNIRQRYKERGEFETPGDVLALKGVGKKRLARIQSGILESAFASDAVGDLWSSGRKFFSDVTGDVRKEIEGLGGHFAEQSTVVSNVHTLYQDELRKEQEANRLPTLDYTPLRTSPFLQDFGQLQLAPFDPNITPPPTEQEQGLLDDFNRAIREGNLQSYYNIGPVLADRVRKHYDEHGEFGSVRDLMGVTGIGPVRAWNIRTGVYDKYWGRKGVQSVWTSELSRFPGRVASAAGEIEEFRDEVMEMMQEIRDTYEETIRDLNLSDTLTLEQKARYQESYDARIQSQMDRYDAALEDQPSILSSALGAAVKSGITRSVPYARQFLAGQARSIYASAARSVAEKGVAASGASRALVGTVETASSAWQTTKGFLPALAPVGIAAATFAIGEWSLNQGYQDVIPTRHEMGQEFRAQFEVPKRPDWDVRDEEGFVERIAEKVLAIMRVGNWTDEKFVTTLARQFNLTNARGVTRGN